MLQPSCSGWDKEETLNNNIKNITGKTPSTKPTLVETKHYYNNLKHIYIYSNITKKKQSNISDYKIEQKHNSLSPDLQPVLS